MAEFNFTTQSDFYEQDPPYYRPDYYNYNLFQTLEEFNRPVSTIRQSNYRRADSKAFQNLTVNVSVDTIIEDVDPPTGEEFGPEDGFLCRTSTDDDHQPSDFVYRPEAVTVGQRLPEFDSYSRANQRMEDQRLELKLMMENFDEETRAAFLKISGFQRGVGYVPCYQPGLGFVSALKSEAPSPEMVKQPDVSLTTLTQAIPREIFDAIFKQVRTPRILTINVDLSTQTVLEVDPTIERIPGALFVDRMAKDDTLKTHTIEFRGLISQPALFNRDTDVLHIHGEVTIRTLAKLPSRGFAQARAARVRFLAIDHTEWLYEHTDASYTLAPTIAMMIRLFGTAEKLFIIAPPLSDTPHFKVVEWKTLLESTIEIQHTKAVKFWTMLEGMGRQVPNKWQTPEVVIVWEDQGVMDLNWKLRILQGHKSIAY